MFAYLIEIAAWLYKVSNAPIALPGLLKGELKGQLLLLGMLQEHPVRF